MARILNGKKLAEKILKSLKKEIIQKRLKLKLAVILVGKNSVSKIHIRKKQEACKKIGISFKVFKFLDKINNQEFKKEVKKIAEDINNSGIVIQLPLPKKIKTQEILNLIPGEKDIDVLSERSRNKFRSGNLPILPPIAEGIQALLKEYKISLKNKNIVLVGKGKLVGRPLALWLLKKKVNFSVLDKSSADFSSILKKADIIISGTGQPGLITGEMVKKGIVAIDAGTFAEDGKLRGDIDFKSIYKKASFITPVPGGVGPMTVACLLENLVKLNKAKSR